MGTPIYLGTVAIEPNRWGLAEDGGRPLTFVSEWQERIAGIGFDGLELWERHATDVADEELQSIVEGPLAVPVFNSYAGWENDDEDAVARKEVGGWVTRVGADSVKFNVGWGDDVEVYQRRLDEFEPTIPTGVRLLCECHFGTAAEDPVVAVPMFDAVADRDRLQSIIHLSREPDELFAPALAGFGDRIGHVHVQLMDVGPDVAAADLAEDLEPSVRRLRAIGFDGSVTLEFCHGVGTDDDHPAALLDRAERDHEALRVAFGD